MGLPNGTRGTGRDKRVQTSGGTNVQCAASVEYGANSAVNPSRPWLPLWTTVSLIIEERILARHCARGDPLQGVDQWIFHLN